MNNIILLVSTVGLILHIWFIEFSSWGDFSWDFLHSFYFWSITLALAHPYALYCFIWNNPESFRSIAEGRVLKPIGKHAVEVFSNLHIVTKLTQLILAILWYRSVETDLVIPNVQRALISVGMIIIGQTLNIGIYKAIGKDGVYYGFKLGQPAQWCTNFPFDMDADATNVLDKYKLDIYDTALICGDGNFGFSRSLMHLGFRKIIATEIHDEYTPKEAHANQFQENISSLRQAGHEVLFNVDATNKEHLHELTERYCVDSIWWNNPHITREDNVMKIENQTLMLDFFKAVPRNVRIKMILTRKQYADWIVAAAFHTNWEIARDDKVHYEPFAQFMIDMRPRETREKYLKRHLTLHGRKIRLSKFPFYKPMKTDLSDLPAKKMYLIEFVAKKYG